MSSAADSFPDLMHRLQADGVAGRAARLTPLTGGVSSDIYRLDEPGRPPLVVKRALPQLRVCDEWLADLSRNAFEQKYLRYVGEFLPDSVPQIVSSGDGYFVMEYLGDAFANWKTELLAGRINVSHAASAGTILGRIHAHSRGDERARLEFDSTKNFFELRADPYLVTTGLRHPAWRDAFQAESDRLCATRQCLVHGDYSPKNALVSAERFVVLDCEVAWYGDPAFDVGFLLNHLLLKGAHFAPSDPGLFLLARTFVDAYVAAADWGELEWRSLEERTARLLAMLLVARIDGKSPVEYLSTVKRDLVRRSALALLTSDVPRRFDEFFDRWAAALKGA